MLITSCHVSSVEISLERFASFDLSFLLQSICFDLLPNIAVMKNSDDGYS